MSGIIANVGLAVDAIPAAADMCLYRVYDVDTTAIRQETFASFLGIGLLAGGIVNSIIRGPTALSTLTAVGGAGVTAASNLQEQATTHQYSVSNIINAGVNYYPLMEARVDALKSQLDNSEKHSNQRLDVLAAMWDAAGAGCPVGIFKGQSWFNRLAEKSSGQHLTPR